MTEHEKLIAELDRQNLRDLEAIMNTPEGRRFFCWLNMKCGKDKPSFSRDSLDMAFNEGMRNVSLMLEGFCRSFGAKGLDIMNIANKEYVAFQSELIAQIRAGGMGK